MSPKELLKEVVMVDDFSDKGRVFSNLTLLHPEKPKLYAILAFLSAIGLKPCVQFVLKFFFFLTFACKKVYKHPFAQTE